MPPAKVEQRKENSKFSWTCCFSFIENGELKIENFGNAQSAFIQ